MSSLSRLRERAGVRVFKATDIELAIDTPLTFPLPHEEWGRGKKRRRTHFARAVRTLVGCSLSRAQKRERAGVRVFKATDIELAIDTPSPFLSPMKNGGEEKRGEERILREQFEP